MVKNKFRAGSQRVQVKFARFRSQTQTRAAEGGTFATRSPGFRRKNMFEQASTSCIAMTIGRYQKSQV